MNDNIHINVSYEVLVWARESLALTRNQAAEKTEISVKRLLQLETGEKQPALEELKAISKAYKRTIATLLLNSPPKEKPLPTDRRTLDSKDFGNFSEKTIMAVRKARALALSSVELREELGLDFPKFNLFASIKEPCGNAARRIHSHLQLDEIRDISNVQHALEAYIERVESLGVAVFQLSLTQDRLRGFSITDDLVPIIGIKRGNEQAHSKTFTLFHELGHVLLRESGMCDLSDKTNLEIEQWCNGFSAEILVPSAELLQMPIVLEYQRNDQKIWAKKDLVEIANHFHVGPLSILRCLLDKNLTTQAFYKEKHTTWNKPQFGKSKNPEGRNLAREAIAEKGKTYVGLAFNAYDQNRINIKDLSDFLGVKLSCIPKTRQLLSA
ncbi:MAG: XRE family transcriptional regulator [Bacteroidetes bacterium]|nr:XRE family transcriptional regulator [Bacteroidota bacterium]MBU1717845.1 XRE family transcriptional regulator [Bacteroidota bacterium]